jgi:hypothetical protein
LAAGNYDEAAAGFAAVAQAEADPVRADLAKIGQGNALLGGEKFADALGVFADVAGRGDSAFALEATYRSAVVCYRSGDFAGARKHLDAVLAADDEDDTAGVKGPAEQFLNRLDLFDAEAVKASFVPPEPKEEETKEETDK